MNYKNLRRWIVSSLLALCAGSVLAEDIDIYSQNTTITPGAPNVLIVMDNTANWSQSFASSTKFAAQMTALSQVINALKSEFRLGLMFFTETGGGNSNTDGGYVRFAIQDMTDSSGNATAARNCLLKMVGSGNTCTSANTNYSLLDIIADKSNGGKAGVTMGEVYDYFAGLTAYAGNNKVKADPLAFTSNSIAGPTYKSPITQSCQKNFVIVISNGAFQDSASSTSTATSQLSAAGGAGATTVINPPDNGTSNNNVSDEWVRFLNKVSTVAAVTYTLEVGPSTTGQGPYNTALLQSMGTQGKGGYYSAVDAATLNKALNAIFNDIQAVNSVFASASLPLSADNTGAFVNQVYMGVFRPDGQGKPRWLGNLKEYQFAVDSNNNLYLSDATGLAAAGSTGFAKPDATSFWTSKSTTSAPDLATQAATSTSNGSTNGFWYFDSKGSGGNFDSPDGEWVEKGGAAEQLRLTYLGYGGTGHGAIGDQNNSTAVNGVSPRQVYTCTGSCLTSGTSLSTTPFDASNSALTTTSLGLTTAVNVSTYVSDSSISGTAVAGSTSTVSSISKSGSKAVATTLAAHSFAVGDSVAVAGNAYSGYNGTYTITATTSTTFTYTPGSTTSGAQSGGTATSAAATTVTVTTATAHSYQAGDTVTVSSALTSALNGIMTVVAVPTTTTFTYTLGTGIAYVSNVVSVARNRATVTTTTAHGFAAGDSVTIAGASVAGYNGAVTVGTTPSTTTFTYTYTSNAPLANGSGGTATKSVGGLANLIKWIRGQDVLNENGFQVAGADTDVRASIHGDVLHSRPVVLNYSSSSSSSNVYVFYGGNDGVFRAIKGGQAATDGKEQWAFIPTEFFTKLARLYNNSPQVLYPSTSSGITPTPTKRDYFFDGPVTSYIKRNSSGVVTKAVLFITVRRGGSFIYAIDITTPTDPKFLWKKSNADGGFGELGQTWSQPVVATINAQTNPVLIFGAGYDATSEDPDIPATSDTIGRGIYVIDALTGAPIWAASNATANFGSLPSGMTALAVSGMNFSISSDVTVIDRTLDGIADRIYAVDVASNVWRVDINDTNPANWAVWKIAALGQRTASTANAAARKLMFSPDVVFGTSYDSIVLGTGDREHPLSTSSATQAVVNRFYMIKDPNVGTTGANLGLTDTCGATFASTCSSFFDATSGGSVPAAASGWSVTLATGEKVINGPIVTGSHTIFGTNKPDTSNTACTANLGVAQRYDVNYLTGLGGGAFKDANGNTVTSEVAIGGGFLPSPVSGVVQIGGVPYIFTTDNPLNPGGVIPITITVPQKRNRIYWHEKLE